MKLTNKMYDILKKISLMAVPVVAFISAMSEIWGFGYGTEIAATVSAVGTLLGACLTISTHNYQLEMLDGADDHHEDGLG